MGSRPDKGSDIDAVEIRIPGSLLYRAVTLAIVGLALILTGTLDRNVAEIPFGAIALAVAARTAAVKLTADGAQVVIRNPVWSYSIDWAEVEGVDLEDRRLRFVATGLGLRRRRVVLRTSRGAISVAATQSITGDSSWRSYFGGGATTIWLERLRSLRRQVVGIADDPGRHE
jgi:hypothetical protein